MKYKDPITGEFKDITIKAGDTLPVGAILEFDGDVIPAGYEEVTDEVDQKEVFVGPNEPTTGEEVWLQKGKNLFNKDSSTSGAINDLGYINTSTLTNTSDYIPVKAGQTYTFSYEYTTLGTENNRSYAFYDTNKTHLGNTLYNPTNKIVNITPTQDGYIRIAYDKNCYNIQFELGEKTPYEPYIDKKIHTLNDNGVYEEFYNAEPIIKSLSLGSFTTSATGYQNINLPSASNAILGVKYARGGSEGAMSVNIVSDNSGNQFIKTMVDGNATSCVLNSVIVYYID